MHSILIITNGSSAADAMPAAGIEADILPWDDVLHDGPVRPAASLEAQSDARSAYLASKGWGDADAIRADFARRDAVFQSASDRQELVVWFEHDLYDQLQLLQVLHELARRPAEGAVSFIQHDTFIGMDAPEGLAGAFAARVPLPPSLVEWGAALWHAFTMPTPAGLEAAIHDSDAGYPHLHNALVRLAEMYPDVRQGLSRTERSVVEGVAAGVVDPVGLFRRTQAEEEAAFMGDWSFWSVIGGLLEGESPLLAADRPFKPPPEAENVQELPATRLSLTPFGEAVRAAEVNRVRRAGIDRWIGGTRLHRDAVWFWEERGRRFVEGHAAT